MSVSIPLSSITCLIHPPVDWDEAAWKGFLNQIVLWLGQINGKKSPAARLSVTINLIIRASFILYWAGYQRAMPLCHLKQQDRYYINQFKMILEKIRSYNMENLPNVISCCFCCFLRAGSVMIGVVSMITGLILAPNVNHAPGFWDLGVINTSNAPVESTSQMLIGVSAIGLCIISGLLIIGSLCNIPKLINIYQWGAVAYCVVTVVIYFTLAMYCFIAAPDSVIAGLILLLLIILNILLTGYFIIVVNSLRMSMMYINSAGILDL